MNRFEKCLGSDYLNVKGEKEDEKGHGTSCLDSFMYGFIINQDREYQGKMRV